MRAAGLLFVAACTLCLGAAQAQDAAALAGEAREAALALQKTLAGKLLAELQASGPEAAIQICKTLAPQAAGDLSRTRGWRVTRVSLKVRNPVLGSPDPWEQRALADFDARAARGEKPEALEAGEIVDEPQGRYYRYARALPVAPLCLNCHGAAEAMPAGVRERVAKEYPHDRATGYREGQIRGAISVKRPLE
jgi:Protein of unknown function (DUF3365)